MTTETENKLAQALREILEYRGGADSALDDPYVMERAREALEAYESRAQPASVADGFASWGDWLESMTDDELITIFYHYPDAANSLKRLLAAAPQPQAKGEEHE